MRLTSFRPSLPWVTAPPLGLCSSRCQPASIRGCRISRPGSTSTARCSTMKSFSFVSRDSKIFSLLVTLQILSLPCSLHKAGCWTVFPDVQRLTTVSFIVKSVLETLYINICPVLETINLDINIQSVLKTIHRVRVSTAELLQSSTKLLQSAI